ncbi:MAG: hypothetical protein HYW25_02515 [Candidatus Aenigmarchaeota archaeon]|nr:hypothetical protein [Candidatus Aenigmarchaeota archaeon]
MRLSAVLRQKKYLALAIAAAIIMALFLPFLQSLRQGIGNLDLWFLTVAQYPLNIALYIAFSIAFGLFIALYSYNRRLCIDCDKKKLGTGALGAFAGFFIGVCPACLGIAAIFLPLSASIALTQYSAVFMLIAVALMLFSIYRMGGFRQK